MYDDGHGYCFACEHYESGTSTEKAIDLSEDNKGLLNGIPVTLTDRGIDQEVCEKYSYYVGKLNGEIVHIANYFDLTENKICGQKIRKLPKGFSCRGNMRDANLWGQQLWPSGGKMIIVTEGEIDCMSVFQAMGRTWPVVSVPNGAAGATDSFRRNLEFLNSYDSVVICFDSDEPGQKAAIACSALLLPGKAKIAKLPMKDANEMVVAERNDELRSSIWNSQTYRPEGIVHVRDVTFDADNIGRICDYPWNKMNKELYGRRSGELVVHTSGSGMGKSTVLREMIWYDLTQGIPVGLMMLEESIQDTVLDLISLLLNKPVKKIFASRKINERRAKQGKDQIEFDVVDDLSDSEFMDAKAHLLDRGLYLLDHFGSTDADLLISKMDYMATSLGCMNIYLDHLSIVISGNDSGNERKDIDVMMTNLRTFVERSDCHVDAVCHLTKPKATPFEEGGQISLRDLRGSGSLYQLADLCIGYERNQQHSDELIRNTISVRSLKDRFGGKTGIISALRYNSRTGRLAEIDYTTDEDGMIHFETSAGDTQSYSQVYGRPIDGGDHDDPIL